MTVAVEKAIQFTCEVCGHIQYADYSLYSGWYEDRAVMEDRVLCEKCGHDNHVIEEL